MQEDVYERGARLIKLGIDRFGINVLDRSDRKRPKTDLRFVMCYILRKEHYKLAEISQLFNIDHVTVMHGERRVYDAITYHFDKQLEGTYHKFINAMMPQDRPATIHTNPELLNTWLQSSSLSLLEIRELMANYEKLNVY